MQFQADMTDEQLFDSEKAAQSWGVTRRAAITMLARSSDDIEMDEGAANAFMELAGSVTEYLKWRETERELLEAAQARLFISCRTS